MAEIFGVVAGAFSVVSLLDQIIESIDNLRALRSFVKSAPTELQDLIEDAEVVQGVLETLSPESLAFLNRPSTGRRLLTFQKDLEATIEEMKQYTLSVASRKIGAVRLAWKKEAIRARKQNLDNIKGTLVLLQGSYCSASLREHNASIRDLAAAIQSYTARENTKCLDVTVHEEQSDEGSYQVSTKPRKRYQKSKPVDAEYRVRLPLGFIDKVWTLQTKRLTSGWTFTIQTHNVISDSSPVFEYCVNGDIKAVQSLFSSRLATPVDCNSVGTSLLSIAAFYGQVDMCRMLLDNGASLDHKNSMGGGPLDYANIYSRTWVDFPEDIPVANKLFQMLITGDEDENILFEDRIGFPRWFSHILCPPEALDLLQRRVSLDYAALPLSVRFKRAMMIDPFYADGSSPEMFQTAMGGVIEPCAYLMEDKNGSTLLQKVAQCLAMDFFSQRSGNKDSWRRMLRDGVAASADLHKLTSDWPQTPLVSYFDAYIFFFDKIKSSKWSLLSPLRNWVSELKAVGVDIEAYGAKENALHKSGRSFMEFYLHKGALIDILSTDEIIEDSLEFRVLDFTYGPEPDDWYIWVTNPLDEFAGEFWELVNRQSEIMPGTWID
ncbi:hypothetical protein BJX64DRAFT_279957 [Aspergillus heterothallicus]